MPIASAPQGLRIRNMYNSDFDFIVNLFQALEWTATRQDIENLLMYDPLGCFVAELHGEPVGSVTTTMYTHFGWVGMLLVKAEVRRQRIGTHLMKTAIRYLFDKGAATIRLEADPLGIPLYNFLNFQKECDSLRLYRKGPQLSAIDEVRHATLDDLTLVFPLDRRAFGDDRRQILTRFFERSDFTLVVDNEPERGMLMAHDSAHGTYFGPFIADNSLIADKLLRAGLSQKTKQTVLVGVPRPHQPAVTLLKSYGFESKAVLSRMYYGKVPRTGDSCLEYGIGTSATG
ncbi:MAG: GNAT family N-acetyltransferase [Candidatus Thorarchaeota archaeon]